MDHSAYIVRLIVLTTLMPGCASGQVHSDAASRPIETIEYCVPGTIFMPGTDYLVMKVPSRAHMLFQRLDYTCLEDGIEFAPLPAVPKRTHVEACQSLYAYSDRGLPQVLFLHREPNGMDPPVIYTRAGLESSADRVLAANPCRPEYDTLPAK